MNLILGTAGHIDHGKSSLVQALTGTNPDRLPEEKKRGVTIDLGFAHLPLGGHSIGIIDVPGHADFVNNMVAGVGSLDIALFIVAADDGWMPQSEEHLQILDYLGTKHTLIALTKSDLAEDIEFTLELLREELIGTSLETTEIIPVSAHTGEGLDTLKAAIGKMVQGLPKAPKNLIPRLAVDRTFSPTGIGTVVTGTLTGDALHLGDTLHCYPQQLSSNIRSIQCHSSKVDTASAGMRTALNLPEIPLASRGKKGIARGSLVAASAHLIPSDTIDVQLTRSDRPIRGQQALRELKHTETVLLHLGSARTRARVVLHSQNTLAPGDSCFAQLRLEEPIACCIGDRFVIRDGAQQGTLAGGIVLDALAQRRHFRTESRLDFLRSRLEAPDDLRQMILSELIKSPLLSALRPLDNAPFTDDYTQRSIKKLTQKQKLTLRDECIIDPVGWQRILDLSSTLILTHHKAQPDAPGMPLEAWRAQLLDAGVAPKLIPAIEKQLTSAELEFQKVKDCIASASHTLVLPPHLEPLAEKLLSTFQAAGLQPPARVEMAPDADSQQALRFLIRSGKVIELDPKALLRSEDFEAARRAVIRHLEAHQKATASELRSAVGTSRKILMPLLEGMDAAGITKRNGDFRELVL